jgi:excisionase family DNA binding protein
MASRSTPDRPRLTREDVLDAHEVAELLHMPLSTVLELARRAVIPGHKLGRRWIFLHDEIEAGVRRAPRQAQARSAPQPPAAQHLRPTGKRSKWYPEVVPDPDSAHQPRLVG